MEFKDQKEPIKDAFLRIKEDISALKDNISFIYQQLNELKRTLDKQSYQKQSEEALSEPIIQQIPPEQQTNQQIIPSNKETPADKWASEAVKNSIFNGSTGNRGVPTDRQTNQQTDKQPLKSSFKAQNTLILSKSNEIEKVSELLSSLDEIKQDLRSKFKHLTKQEMIIFSAIYQLEEESFVVDYPRLALKLGLSESSIRDYVQRLIKKGIPLQKTKENNKKITLSIAQDIKKIASLQTILSLREL